MTKTETQPIARSVPEKAAAGSVRTGWSRRCATSQVGPGRNTIMAPECPMAQRGPMGNPGCAPWPRSSLRLVRPNVWC